MVLTKGERCRSAGLGVKIGKELRQEGAAFARLGMNTVRSYWMLFTEADRRMHESTQENGAAL